ncbi:Nif11-like leader peptide family natural product precursor [Oribacterium sp. P6A1]|uniref:Nif11-like leader peptide family natural product precursor n=1 Tax=Oribacterium sp. P6A1 TaxID=1410612 RepID=UPI000559F78D|nr:Nif11-like leader peptide family natural product precursor [Oribacterium sp. P6A1]
MDVETVMAALRKKALEDAEFRQKLLDTQKEKNPLAAFCNIAREEGYELYEMDILTYGEEFYAAIKRSTNGGGENSPKLEGQDDYYDMFMAELAGM